MSDEKRRTVSPITRSAFVMAWLRTDEAERGRYLVAVYGAATEGFPEPPVKGSLLDYSDAILGRLALRGESATMDAIREGNQILAPWIAEMFPAPAEVEKARDFSDPPPVSG